MLRSAESIRFSELLDPLADLQLEQNARWQALGLDNASMYKYHAPERLSRIDSGDGWDDWYYMTRLLKRCVTTGIHDPDFSWMDRSFRLREPGGYLFDAAALARAFEELGKMKWLGGLLGYDNVEDDNIREDVALVTWTCEILRLDGPSSPSRQVYDKALSLYGEDDIDMDFNGYRITGGLHAKPMEWNNSGIDDGLRHCRIPEYGNTGRSENPYSFSNPVRIVAHRPLAVCFGAPWVSYFRPARAQFHMGVYSVVPQAFVDQTPDGHIVCDSPDSAVYKLPDGSERTYEFKSADFQLFTGSRAYFRGKYADDGLLSYFDFPFLCVKIDVRDAIVAAGGTVPDDDGGDNSDG